VSKSLERKRQDAEPGKPLGQDVLLNTAKRNLTVPPMRDAGLNNRFLALA